MSTKLFRANRAAVVDRIVKTAFAPQLDLIGGREHDMADQAYNAVFTAEERRLMATLPDGWLPRTSYVSVKINGTHGSLALRRPRPVPFCRREVVWETDDPEFVEAWRRLIQDRYQLLEQCRTVEENAWSVLNACRTVAELRLMWPGVEPFLGDLADPPPPPLALPSPQIAALNTLLGLTPA